MTKLTQKEKDAFRIRLRKEIAKDIKKHGKIKIKVLIEYKIVQLGLLQMYSTKGGILGTRDWDRIQFAIDTLREIQKEL